MIGKPALAPRCDAFTRHASTATPSPCLPACLPAIMCHLPFQYHMQPGDDVATRFSLRAFCRFGPSRRAPASKTG